LAILLHLVHWNRLLLKLATKDPKPGALKKQIDENAKNYKQEIDKDAIIQSLTERSRRSASTRVLTFLDVHLAEHTGQAIAYAVLVGIAPPWPN